jgi:hypothetical protein
MLRTIVLVTLSLDVGLRPVAAMFPGRGRVQTTFFTGAGLQPAKSRFP